MPAGEIFVSYAREDIAFVSRLAAALTARGLAVWWDRRLLAGQSFEAVIGSKLAGSPFVIVVWSAASIGSDWVKDEAAEGQASQRLVPLSIDGARPPFGFRQLHTPDFSSWNGAADAPEIDDLAEALRGVTGRTVAAAPPAVMPAGDERTTILARPDFSRSSPSLPRPPREPTVQSAGEGEVTWFAPRDLREGEEVAQFRIVRKLAQGGFGAAYEARNSHNDDERVVLKVLLPDISEREQFADLLKHEANALQRVKHDAVVQYRTFGRMPASDEFFLVVEYLDGPTLAEWRRGTTPNAAAIEGLAIRLMAGLAAAHAQGIIHRDLSPDNIILPGGDLAKATIIDFGIARNGTLNPLGAGFSGKLSWAAPEQFEPALGEVGPWTDLYSLGLVMAFLARGEKLAIGGGGDFALAAEARREVPPLDGVSPVLRPAIVRFLQPDPRDRSRTLNFSPLPTPAVPLSVLPVRKIRAAGSSAGAPLTRLARGRVGAARDRAGRCLCHLCDRGRHRPAAAWTDCSHASVFSVGHATTRGAATCCAARRGSDPRPACARANAAGPRPVRACTGACGQATSAFRSPRAKSQNGSRQSGSDCR